MTGDAQRGGDKIFLNLPKCRKIPLVWEVNPKAGLCVIAGLARRRGGRAWRRAPAVIFSCSRASVSIGAACAGAMNAGSSSRS
jgi:hypothetical protein